VSFGVLGPVPLGATEGFGVVGVDDVAPAVGVAGFETKGVVGLFNAPLVGLTGFGVPGFEDKLGLGVVLGGRLVNLVTRSIKVC
jgi:hypothetical protein